MKPVFLADDKAFLDRAGRYDFLRSHFKEHFASAERILDVGCDENYLKRFFGDRVYGIDIGGTPDRVVDLEKEALRSFPDASYDLVICTEVLEHLDNFHEMVDELIRVARGAIIISLPNCSSTRRMWRVLRTGRNWKFYGLPYEKPSDRHKWFFSYKEIIDFFLAYSEKNHLRLREVVLNYGIRFPNERRSLHRLKQCLQSVLVRWIGWRNQCESVTMLIEKTS